MYERYMLVFDQGTKRAFEPRIGEPECCEKGIQWREALNPSRDWGIV